MLSPRIFSGAALLIIAGTAVWLMTKGGGPAVETPAAPVLQALQRVPQAGPLHPPRPAPVPFTAAEFTALKERLAALDAEWDGNPPVPPELLKLAGELVDRAPFSAEMTGILDMDAEGKLNHMAGVIRDVMADRLKQPGSAALRLRLVETTRDNPNSGFYPVEEWHLSAGEGCDPAEYRALGATVTDVNLRRLLTTGQAMGLARTHPEEAIALALAQPRSPREDAVRGGVSVARGLAVMNGDQGSYLLTRVIDNLQPGADFRALEALLPQDGAGERSGAGDSYRQQLLVKWGAADPAASAAWVLAHTAEVPVRAMSDMVDYFGYGNPDAAAAWIRAFPPGKYYDAAALNAAPMYGNIRPEAFREILSLVQDPDVRRLAMEDLERRVSSGASRRIN